MGRVQKQTMIVAASLIALCVLLVLCIAQSAGASTSSLRDQVRIRDGVIQVYEGGTWNSVDSVDALNAEDPFFLAKEERAEIDAALSQANAEVAQKAIGSTVQGSAWGNVLVGSVTHEAPQEAPSTSGGSGYYSGGGYSGGGSGWSGGSGGSGGGGNSGGGGGSSPSTPSNPSTGQEVLNPWSPDVM